ncbi:MAG: hypothetical protein QXE18_05420 [Thermoplasmata archaeon]
MNIALLGWGSLIWKPGLMKLASRWHFDGPMLPIEFARISRGSQSNSERLTLVIHEGGRPVPALWAMLENETLRSAILDLASREGCKPEFIGYVICDSKQCNCRVIPRLSDSILAWAVSKKLDAAIWTDLPSNFYEKTGTLLTEYNLLKYLRKLRASGNTEAIEYVKKAPAQIKTGFREVIEKEFKIIT